MAGSAGGGVSHVVRRVERSATTTTPRKRFRKPSGNAKWYRHVNAWLVEQSSAARSDAMRAVNQTVLSAAHATRDATDVVALSVLFGAAAVDGDRRMLFSCILEHIRTGCGSLPERAVKVVHLRAACHGSMPVVHGILRDAWEGGGTPGGKPGLVVVGLEDADCFPEPTLRDIVYSCGTRQAQMRRPGQGESDDISSTQSVMLVLGVSISADPIRSALGVTEATMLAPVSTRMPSGEAFFHAFVERVLAPSDSPMVLSSSLFHLLKSQFVATGGSVSMVERFLRDMCGFHFRDASLTKHLEACDGPGCLPGGNAWGESKMGQWKSQWCVVLGLVWEVAKEALDAPDFLSVAKEQDFYGFSSTADRVLLRKRFRAQLIQDLSPVNSTSKLAHGGVKSTTLRSIRAMLKSASRQVILKILQSWKRFLASRLEVGPIYRGGSDPVDKLSPAIEALIGECSAPGAASAKRSLADQNVSEPLARSNKAPRRTRASTRSTFVDALQVAEGGDPSSGVAFKHHAKGSHAIHTLRRESLQAPENWHTPTPSALGSIRDTAVAMFDSILDIVEPLRTVPNYEAIFYDDVQLFELEQGQLMEAVEPRSSFFEAMRQSGRMLGDEESLCTPDVAVAYQLLAEHGHVVNLSDWLKAYETTRTSSVHTTTGCAPPMDPATKAKLEFVHVVSELESLGVVKYASRRTDHVTRQVFE